MFHKVMNPVVILMIVLLVTVNRSESREIDFGKYENLGHAWYNDHNIVMFDYTNLTSVIASGTTAWYVEFFVSWCGHCQRFRPTWTSFAKSVSGWSDIVRVGALACSNDDNWSICGNYQIEYFPNIRYFSIEDQSLGVQVHSRKETGLMYDLIRKLENDQREGKGRDNWPDLSPYSGEDVSSWQAAAPPSVQYQLLVFEENNSTLGSEVILDFHKWKNLQIRRVTEDNFNLTESYNITAYPALIVLDREDEPYELELLEPSREGINQVIRDLMQSAGFLPDFETTTTSIENASGEVEDSNFVKKHVEDLVYSADLEAALGYTLRKEIPTTWMIKDDRLEALEEFLKVISQYFPLREGNSEFLDELYHAISGRSNIAGTQFSLLVDSYKQKHSPNFMMNRKWVGCQGSQARYRGFPCGLWTLFHTLTVSHAEAFESEDPESRSAGMVLSAMYGFIKNFFSCSNCVEHFVEMANRRNVFNVSTVDDSILWLWEAHNEVNQRLSGDVTEDTAFPKIQYPSQEDCDICRYSDGSWNLQEVLKYLKSKYRYSNIVSSAVRIERDRQ
ncbi:sulfhydryl oxidase 1-like [Diachasmimorpha longicaudata]|uniref:sulfhydryl oxidase 1-like n=1 Tax=Diachasmimorpha longicaudata TaxID=58733 RepID=UPI0030B8E001